MWTKCKVVFIPKSGKTTHTKPKDYRPISLSSFLLKTLERVIDIHLRMTLPIELISPNQHAYTKGKSVETALHSLVGSIEESLGHKEYSMVAFLDIEGAFNNVRPSSILSELERLGAEASTCQFIRKLLGNRVICATLGSSTVNRVANRGTPQGGVLSPLLWNLAMNSLLVEMDGRRIKTVAYADDVAVFISGKYLDTISRCMESALSALNSWSISCGLSVNPLKTELVLFTRRYKIDNFIPPKLNGIRLKIAESAKYLGIILDRKLSWTLNIQNRINKAYVAIYSCKKAIGTNWGINSRGINWIVNAVIRPILFYGVLVWWHALGNSSQRHAVERVLRNCAILITGAVRTTPTKALFTMLNWLPVDLMATQLALNSAVRLKIGYSWNQRDHGHSIITRHCEDAHRNVDYCIPKPSFDLLFSTCIPTRTSWVDGLYTPNEAIRIFTDGSKKGNRVGGGFYIEQFGIRSSFRLPDFCSVLQAEISAIKRAANWLRYYRVSGDICIFTDSKAAVSNIAGVYVTSRLTTECRISLNEIAEHSRIALIWVPGHSSIQGNYIADDLAKKGTTLADEEIDSFTGINMKSLKLLIQDEMFRRAQVRWTNEITCSIARSTWPLFDAGRTKSLLSFRRDLIRLIVSLFTGHCTFGTHARRLGLQYNDFCRSCHNEEEEETIIHFLCECPALSLKRERILGAPFLTCLGELSRINPRCISTFAKESGWFDRGAANAE